MDRSLTISNNEMMQLAAECKNSTEKLDINESLIVLFVQCGLPLEKSQQQAPFYADRLILESRTDLILQAILSIADSLTSDKYKIPTVGDILAKYKILKYSEANQFRSSGERQTSETSQLFWAEFYKCKEDGITDLNEISKIIINKIGGGNVRKSKCKNNFCDGKGYLIAIKKGDSFRNEYILQCKCNDKTDDLISTWNNSDKYKIVKGQSDLLSRK